MPQLQVGDRVRLIAIPSWAVRMPEETQEVLRQALGRILRVRELREEAGDVELWVRNGRDRRRIVGADIIWVEPEYLEAVAPAHEERSARTGDEQTPTGRG